MEKRLSPKTGFQEMLDTMCCLFWDTDARKLDKEANHRYIISRLLCKGGMPGLLWVMDNYSDDAIIDTVIHRRDMDPIVRNYMAQQYRIPKADLIQPGYQWR